MSAVIWTVLPTAVFILNSRRLNNNITCYALPEWKPLYVCGILASFLGYVVTSWDQIDCLTLDLRLLCCFTTIYSAIRYSKHRNNKKLHESDMILMRDGAMA